MRKHTYIAAMPLSAASKKRVAGAWALAQNTGINPGVFKQRPG